MNWAAAWNYYYYYKIVLLSVTFISWSRRKKCHNCGINPVWVVYLFYPFCFCFYPAHALFASSKLSPQHGWGMGSLSCVCHYVPHWHFCPHFLWYLWIYSMWDSTSIFFLCSYIIMYRDISRIYMWFLLVGTQEPRGCYLVYINTLIGHS